MHTRHFIFAFVIISCMLSAGCTQPTISVAPKFKGRLLLLAGDNTNGADLVELTAASTGSTYNYSAVAQGVFEATANPDQTRLLYTTKDGILLRDLPTGAAKPIVKGENYCLAWSPDGNRFSYKQKGPRTGLYVSDLDGKSKLIWEEPFSSAGKGQSSVLERAARASECAHWIAPNRLVFDRFIGLPQTKGEAPKPNTTTVAIVGDSVKLSDSQMKWSIEGVCQAGSSALLRPHDQAQPLMLARSLEHFETADPKPIDCSECRFVGYAARSCVPFFVQQTLSTSTDLLSLNPTNGQRQRAATIPQTFSVTARMLINSSARLMVVGDVPGTLLLIDTETGESVPFFPKSPGSDGPLLSPVPIVWIEN